MISVGESYEFKPCGEFIFHLYPDGHYRRELHVNPAKKQYSKNEEWILRTTENDTIEEQLYYKDNTVVWSRGSFASSWKVLKSFTVDCHVKQALWCSFAGLKLKPIVKNSMAKDSPRTDMRVLDGIGIIQDSIINVFDKNGSEFSMTLPFQVEKVWNMQYGILLERRVSAAQPAGSFLRAFERQEANVLPTLFSVLHPLEEPTPVMFLGSGIGKTAQMHNCHHQIIFATSDHSIVLSYNKKMRQHCVWKLQKTTPQEVNKIFQNQESARFDPSTVHSPISSFSSSLSRLALSSHSPSLNTQSPLTVRSRITSPASRSYSPTSGLIGLSRSSNSPSSTGLASLYRLSPSPAQHSLEFTRNMSGAVSPLEQSSEWVDPLTPDICLELVWTEPIIAGKERNSPAEKIFLTTDVCNQHYMCYLTATQSELRCVKYEESNDRSQLIFGVGVSIPARDAVGLKNMIIVLDISYSLSLYSGTSRVGRLHVSNIPPSRLSLPINQNSGDSPALITSSRPPSALEARFEDEVNLLSPVPTEMNSSLADVQLQIGAGLVTGLRDGIQDKFTMVMNNGSMFRVSLPELASCPLVKLCIEALRYVLPRDKAMQALLKWYCIRNAPGGLGLQTEWQKFMACLLGMMGYDTGKLSIVRTDVEGSMSPVLMVKKAKHDLETSCDQDWIALLKSDHHQIINGCGVFGADVVQPEQAPSTPKCATIDATSILFQHIPAVFFAFHLVYEELKLASGLRNVVEDLAILLFQLASDLQLILYQDLYWRDWPALAIGKQLSTQFREDHLEKLLAQFPTYFTDEPPEIFAWLYHCLWKYDPPYPFPYIPNVCRRTRMIAMLYGFLFSEPDVCDIGEKYLHCIPVSGQRAPYEKPFLVNKLDETSPRHRQERAVLHMTHADIKLKDLEMFPPGVVLPIYQAIHMCRKYPSPQWTEATYTLIGRSDLCEQTRFGNAEKWMKHYHSPSQGGVPTLHKPEEDDDGMMHVENEALKLQFGSDLRVQEVRKMLQSAKPVKIYLVQRPEVSDHEFIEEQERHLLSTCLRTMALPVGRAIFTLSTTVPIITEILPIPKLCLTGRAPPRNTTVDLTHIDVPPNMNMWPLFHNGVAAGLKIMPQSSGIESAWIVYNKPKSTDLTAEHAGFLMALGLHGHLSNLATKNIHDYLCKGHELTSVGLLLGISSAKQCSMDLATTKLLSIHLECLLPPTSTELDIPHIIQVAAVIGIGLVYQRTAHRHMAEVLLGEIGRPPGPEMENCSDRESYSLAAGLALGMVTFGKGSQMAGLSDLNLADHLYHYVVGGYKRPQVGPTKEKYKSPSYQIKEGDYVNVDVTAPGATLALGMMFFRTGNRDVVEWMTAPDTQFLLDYICPDFLLLRTVSKGLILWDEVHPSVAWVESNLPSIVKKYAFNRHVYLTDPDCDIDFSTMSQAYCNIVAGACMVLGLKFAGSANKEAFECLYKFALKSIKINSKYIAEQAGRSTIETCMNVIVLSLAMVMAGTGNLAVLRICRHLHRRIGQAYGYVLYGSHMAVHMALGLLFLGAGKFTLGTSDTAIAAMLCAFFPKFPSHSNDNRYHLQALRHLYVLAVEPRLVLPRDVDTSKACFAHIFIKFKDTEFYKDEKYLCTAPCILPGLHLLKELSVKDDRYWNVTFAQDSNWNSLKNALTKDGSLFVKQKAGQLSYEEDPKGYRTLLAQSLTSEISSGWLMKAADIKCLCSDVQLLTFAEFFCTDSDKASQHCLEKDTQQIALAFLHECATHEKTDVLCLLLASSMAAQRIHEQETTMLDIWQLKLLLALQQANCDEELLVTECKDWLASIIQSNLASHLNEEVLLEYLLGNNIHLPLLVPYLHSLAAFLVFSDIPTHGQLAQIHTEGKPSLPELVLRLQSFHLPISTVMKLLAIIHSQSSSKVILDPVD